MAAPEPPQTLKSKSRPPRLRDSERFVPVDRVAIIDINEREYKKRLPDGRVEIVRESLDEDQLRRICRNSRARQRRGEYGLVFLGHTNDDGPEIDQPPVAGYMVNYVVGTHNGRPTILADLYLDREEVDPSRVLRQFPRRSAEVIGINSPNGFIDSVAMIKRSPERDLGLVTSRNRNTEVISRFACPECEEEDMDAMAGAETDRRGKALKSLMSALQHLIFDSLEEIAAGSGAPGGGGPDQDLDGIPDEMEEEEGEPEGFPEDPSGDEDEGLGDTPSGEPADLPLEGLAEEPSGEPMGEPSGELPGLAAEAPPAEEEEPSGFRKPSRHECGPSHKAPPTSHKAPPTRLDPRKSRYEAGAGFPSPTTSPPTEGGGEDRPKVDVAVAKGRMPDMTRMRKDAEMVKVSRYQRENEELRKRLASAETWIKAADTRARSAEIERKVMQLEHEGYDLDRADEVTRLSRIASDEDVDAEITRMRRRYNRTPVGQDLIPNLWSDVGGSAVEKRPSVAELLSKDRQDEAGDTFGSAVARFARTASIDVRGVGRGAAAARMYRTHLADKK